MTKATVTVQLPPGHVLTDDVRAKLLLGVQKHLALPHTCDADCDHDLAKGDQVPELRKLPHRAPQASVDLALKLYQHLMTQMLDKVVEVLVGGAVAKAEKEPNGGLWTPEQLEEVRAVVARYHAVLALSVFGADAVPPDLLKDLRAAGVAIPDARDLITDGFTFGQLFALLRDPKLSTKTPAEVASLAAQRKQQLALSPAEKAAVAVARKHAGQYVVGLASRVTGQVMQAVVGAEENLTPARMVELIQDHTAANLERRETADKLRSDLGWSMGNWTRDWGRIGMTETNNAIQEGSAGAIEAQHGVDVLVSKVPRGDACPDCRRLYLEGGEPRVFKLSELRRNGTNVGRKKKDWRPVVGATHPWCGCMLVRVPPGTRWEDGELTAATAKSEAKREPRTARVFFESYLEGAQPPVLDLDELAPPARYPRGPHPWKRP